MGARSLQAVVALALCASTAGCLKSSALSRGTTLPIDELYAHRADLPALAARHLVAGRYARAFYVLEHAKSLLFVGHTHTARGVADVGAASRAPVVNRVQRKASALAPAGAARTGGRGGAPAPAARPSAPTRRVEVAAFWRQQRVLARRLQAVAENRFFSTSLVTKGRFVITTVEEIQRSLTGDQVLLDFTVSGDVVYLLLIQRGMLRGARLAASAKQLAALTAALLAAVREGKGDAWQRPASQLYSALLGPFADAVARARVITVVPDAFVANIPFALLRPADGKILLERARLGYLPSASFYRALMQRPLFAEPPRLLAIGDAVYPEPWGALPTARVEAWAVSRIFDGSTVLVGREATESRFRDTYRGYNIYHFATHGHLSGVLASTDSALLLTRGAADDGRLTATEISRLDLSRSHLTVLSACETAVSTSAGTTSLGSISAAFLAAGTPAVIGSQWQVSDDATAALMMNFYGSFLDLGVAAALRRAQLALRRDKRWRHPFFWAAFVLYGWDK